jgi:arylformamidase
MALIDVSLSIDEGLVTWPSDPGIEISRTRAISEGDSANVSELRFGSHTGTHIDSPFHFIEGGTTVSELDLDALVGPCHVCDLSRVEGHVGAADLEGTGLPSDARRVLLKTRNSAIWQSASPSFTEDYVALSEDGARWLVDRGVRLVGIDFLSIEPFGSDGHPVHHALLGAGVVIVEGLDLGAVEPGPYGLACLPLKLTGLDGAPARTVLMTQS